MGLCLVVMLAAPALVLAIPRSDTVAIYMGPGATANDAVIAAGSSGGAIVRYEFAAGIAVVRPVGSADGFISRLYRHGAWIVFDPIVIDGCIVAAEGARS